MTQETIENIVAVLGALHLLAVAVVNLTPTPKDNAALSKAYKAVEVLAGIVTATAKQVRNDGK